MGLGSRTARQHETVASHTAGVDPSLYWEYQPGQGVMTVDGFSGVVASVDDGPLSGTETYNVILDGGLGGGEYTASQLQPKSNHDPAIKTAADDYPELGSILMDRPDIAPNTRWASLRATAGDEHWDWGVEQCPVETCGKPVDTNRGESMNDHLEDEHGEDPNDYHQPQGAAGAWEKHAATGPSSFRAPSGDHDHSEPKGEHGIESFTDLEPNDGATSGVDEHGHLTWDGKSPGCRDTDEYSMFGQNDAVKQAAYYTEAEVRAIGQAEEARQGKSAEEILRAQASACGCGNPGHTNETHEAWAEANNRDAWGRLKMQAYDGHGAWDCNNYECAEHPQAMYDEKSGPQQMPGWQQADSHPDRDMHREIGKALHEQVDTNDARWLLDQHSQGPTHLSSKVDPWNLVVEAAGDSDFRFEVTAAWSDVRNKAKRIRSEGGVHVTLATEGMIHAEVQGEHHVYEAGIQRMPGRQAIQAWSCGCKWGAYHWGADDDFSRFAGRMCSHALALQYEAQSRGMFGRDVRHDDHKPSWVPRMVVVKHDIDAGRDVTGPATKVGSLEKPIETLALFAARNGESFYDTAVALSTVGYDLTKFTPFGNTEAMARWAAVNDAWGEPGVAPAQYTPGPTKPKDVSENPASAGWASAPEPENWGQAGPSGLTHMVSSLADDEALFEPEMGKEAFLPLLIPLAEGLAGAGAGAAAAGAGAEVAGAGAARALAPKLLEKALPAVKQVAPRVLTHELLNAGDNGDQGPAGPGKPAAPQAGPAHGPDDEDTNPLNYGARADLHDQPEGALPSTDGADDDLFGSAGDPGDPAGLEPDNIGMASTGSVQDIVAQFQATAGAAALGGAGGAAAAPVASSGSRDGLDIAAAARMFLETGEKPSEGMQTTALKEFTLVEQQKIINEGANVRAGNFDRLDIKGTHYEPLEAALAAADNDEEWMD